MAGMEHDTHSKPAIGHNDVDTAVHKTVGARVKVLTLDWC